MQHLARKVAMSSVASGRKNIDFFYDVISPYSWFAFEVLMRYKKHWDVNINLRPMLLAGVNHATGNKPPGLVPNKGLYMMKGDIPRCAAYFNVPVKLPEDIGEIFERIMVKGSLVPNRFLTAIDMLYPDGVENASRAFWMTAWSENEDFNTEDSLAKVALAANLTPEQFMEVKHQMTQQETKDRLKATTMKAIEYGAFGAPTIIYHKNGSPELFFGSDRFPLLAREIGEKWLGPEPDLPEAKL